MRIVHVEDTFYPTAGYQINILPKYQALQGHEVIIVTADFDKIPDSFAVSFFGKDHIEEQDKRYTEQTGVKIIRMPIWFTKSKRIFHKPGFYKAIEALDPDVVYAHGDGTISSMCFIRRNIKHKKYAVVFDSHMLEMASTNKFKDAYRSFYKAFYTPAIKKKKYVFIRTQDDAYVEKCLGIPLSQAPWISVGSDTLLFHPDADVRESFREQHGMGPDDFVVVYTGKLDDAKGGKFLAETFRKRLTPDNDRRLILVVVGSASGDYGKEVEEIFSQSENEIMRFPTQNYTDLAQFYQAADLSIFPKQCSLSFYDAQACGLPVVSEDNTVNTERLTHNNGLTFQAGDAEDFRDKVLFFANLRDDHYARVSKNAFEFVKKSYDYADIAQKYTETIEKERVRQLHEKKGL